MDSINQQQEENNRQNLTNADAIEKIRELFDEADCCFFCTNMQARRAFTTRPMAVQKIDRDGTCWFLSANDSKKNQEIDSDPTVQLLFQASKHAGFVSLSGNASISTNKSMIRELWNPIMKTWFTKGEDDPRITVIKFVPVEGYYWDTKHGALVAFAKQIAGAMVGKTMDDSIEGELKP